MNCKILYIYFFIFLISCTDQTKKINYTKKFNNYSNKGFALVYDDKLLKNKFINRKLNDRSLLIFNNFLENETPVKVTNLINGKYLVAKVGKNAEYPSFYNSVLSKRIAANLDINLNEPYVEIKTLNQNKSFIINKAKTFEEEKKVADKAPVEGIIITDINNNKNTKIKKNENSVTNEINFKYIIKIADFYFESSAIILKDRLINEYNISNVKLKKISTNNYRIYKGPFNSLDSIKEQYNDIMKLPLFNI